MRRHTPLCMRADVPVLQYMPPRRIATNIAKLLLDGAARGEERAAIYVALAQLWLKIADRDEHFNRQRLKTGHS
jgi:hypothetical protein